MKKVLIAAAIAATLMAPQAFAQANNFAGVSVGLNGNLATTATELSAPTGLVKFGESSQNASVQAAYGLVMGSIAVLNLGVTYNLGDLKGGLFTSAGNSFEMKGKDMYSFYIEPGVTLSNATLIYAKLAYLGVKGEITGSGITASENFDGVGYGAGIRAKLDRNLFLQVEFAQSNFNSKTIQGASLKPTASIGSIGIGYLF